MDYQQYEQIEKNLRYIASMRPVFNKRALFSDMTADYISPQEPGTFFKSEDQISQCDQQCRLRVVCTQ